MLPLFDDQHHHCGWLDHGRILDLYGRVAVAVPAVPGVPAVPAVPAVPFTTAPHPPVPLSFSSPYSFPHYSSPYYSPYPSPYSYSISYPFPPWPPLSFPGWLTPY
ncbi:hypothetical protein M1K46_14145 [Fictibacillus sp. WQ 8-8]|uniref:hypothetical protein n=1 Tax=unclassified Fictibacillus TaxID=2644029 RepID=UPI0006A7BE40|nr:MULTISPECIES: hypothetical protein [unclassified Fictibacillus]MCQ6266795.1 hypothetical protein [Fictibacillus sp. WQ 8-8]MED2973838.1 hypothetical protein [Fictibacillus sp. B-59209]